MLQASSSSCHPNNGIQSVQIILISNPTWHKIRHFRDDRPSDVLACVLRNVTNNKYKSNKQTVMAWQIKWNCDGCSDRVQNTAAPRNTVSNPLFAELNVWQPQCDITLHTHTHTHTHRHRHTDRQTDRQTDTCVKLSTITPHSSSVTC